MKFRSYIIRSLWTGSVLAVLLLIFLFLWLALSSLGDTSGSQAAKGGTLALSICFGFNIIALVVLLALAHIDQTSPEKRSNPETSTTSRNDD